MEGCIEKNRRLWGDALHAMNARQRESAREVMLLARPSFRRFPWGQFRKLFDKCDATDIEQIATTYRPPFSTDPVHRLPDPVWNIVAGYLEWFPFILKLRDYVLDETTNRICDRPPESRGSFGLKLWDMYNLEHNQHDNLLDAMQCLIQVPPCNNFLCIYCTTGNGNMCQGSENYGYGYTASGRDDEPIH